MALSSSQTVKKILVVKLRALGDVLTTFPLLRALKERYPDARLDMMADEMYRDILETNPRIDRLHLHPAGQLRTAGQVDKLRNQLKTIAAIRREKYDLFIDLYGSLRTAMWGWWGGIPHRMGFHLRGRRYFYNHTIHAKHRYVVDLNLQFAEELGWTRSGNQLEFFVTQEDETAGHRILAEAGLDVSDHYIVISVGGGWPLKQWGAERFGRVAKSLVKHTGCRIVLTGQDSEAPLMQACEAAGGISMVHAVGLPLRQVAAVIRESRLFIGNDSGPKYFAEAFGVPTLICYGPTDAFNNNPQTPKNRVACFQTDCRPCHSEVCRMPARECMDRISENDVIDMALALWKLNSSEKS